MAGFVGRPPKPTALKIVQGNTGHRPVAQNGFHPEPGLPKPPAMVRDDEDALAEWKRAGKFLSRHRVLTEADVASFALYCMSWARWQRGERSLAAFRAASGGDEFLVKAPSGYPIPNPLLAAVNKAMEQVYQYQQQFGLSPSSRERVTPAAQMALFGDESGNDPAARYF